MLNELVQIQRVLHGALEEFLATFAATGDWHALAAVLPLGIVFGAVHAATPGHSKSVLSSYVLGTDIRAMRALVVSTVLALTHIGSAVIISLTANFLISRSITSAGEAPALILASRWLLLVIGVWLILRAVLGRPHLHGEGFAVAVTAGLIPCPLTLFVMVYALAKQVPVAGLAFSFAMMIGVAVTLSAVALTTVLARTLVLKLASQHGVAIASLGRTADLLAGVLLAAIAAFELAA